MDGKRVLVADASAEFCDALADALKNTVAITTCHDGLIAQSLLHSIAPDVFVMDLAMQGLDGITLLQRIAGWTDRPRILLTTCFISPYIERAISGLGVDMVLMKPCDIHAVAERIVDLLEIAAEPVAFTHQISSVAVLLMDLGLSPRRCGFRYLERAIEYYRQNPGRTLSNVIYPAIAREFHTGEDAVERAIRQLIRDAWNSRDNRLWSRYFGIGRTNVVPRPTNGEFIARLAEHDRLSQREYA